MSKFRLDEVDHQILDMLIDNTRVPFTDIAKKLLISAGTVHVRVKKMEDAGIIQGSSLTLDYEKLGYSFIAYVGVFLHNTSQTKFVLERINQIPFVTVAHVTTGKFNIFCKIRARDTKHAKDVIFMIDDIEGNYRTETMISLEESINDKRCLRYKSLFDLMKTSSAAWGFFIPNQHKAMYTLPKIERFQQQVAAKYHLYNSVFITLPFDAIDNTGVLLPLFSEGCVKGFQQQR